MAKNPPKILVVDDERAILELCSRNLKKAGYFVETISCGDEAVSHLNEGWDIIITDIIMPGEIDGIELLRLARAVGNIDVIIMTAYPELENAIESLREGAYDFLIKPFTFETLLIAVKRCVDKRNLSEELVREKSLREKLEHDYNELERVEKLKETFGQFVTPEIAKFVLNNPEDMWKKPTRKIVTMLFVDVRGFTPYSQIVSPEEAVGMLNRIFAVFINIFQQEGGIVNKFLGDGMLVLFGTPLPEKNHAVNAAHSAIRSRHAIEEMTELRSRHDFLTLQIGIGINTGEVVVGCLGTKHRAEYSVIGYPVNLASRLEKAAEAGQILIGEETAKSLNGRFNLKEVEKIHLKGISTETKVYEIISERCFDKTAIYK